MEAIQILLSEKGIDDRLLLRVSEAMQKEPVALDLPKPRENNKVAYAYLCQRGTSPKIISKCMEDGLIYQTNTFKREDENGEAKYACTRTCFGDGKFDAPDSNKAYAFSFPMENCDTVWVYESAIDLLSHMTLSNYTKKQYPAHRVSLGGCAPVAL